MSTNTVLSMKNQDTTESNAHMKSMVDLSPINTMLATPDGKLVYMNQKSLETLKGLEEHLPDKAENLVGKSIDIFHKNPAYQKGIIADPKNLPLQAEISVGPEILDLLVSPIKDDSGTYIGPMVTWEVVTEKKKNEEKVSRLQQMVDKAPINIMMASPEGEMLYMNNTSSETLKGLENLLPIKVDDMIGSSIDVFHKRPEHQRKIIGDPANLPVESKIRLGDETLSLLVNPVLDQNGTYLGPMVCWEVISEKVQLVENIGKAATQLAAASSEMNATAKEMATNAETTTTELNQAATASTEVSTGVQTVAASAEELNAAIAEIAKNVNESSTLTGTTAGQAQATNETMKLLDTSSMEIGNVTKMISSIAQQTNLLALNATIEAARAGDAGRGFAVVANEVKELANQTASATEDISSKVSGIQDDSKGAVTAIEEISKSVESLNTIASSISASIEEQRATTSEVARIIGESAQGVNEISSSISKISKAAEATSAGATQVLTASQGLSELAEALNQLVEKIKV